MHVISLPYEIIADFNCAILNSYSLSSLAVLFSDLLNILRFENV